MIAEGEVLSAHTTMRKAMRVKVSEGAGHLKGDRPREREGEFTPLGLSEERELSEVLMRGGLKEQTWRVRFVKERNRSKRGVRRVRELLSYLKELSDQVRWELRRGGEGHMLPKRALLKRKGAPKRGVGAREPRG